MIDIENEVIELISTKLRKEFKDCFISGEEVRIISKFPTITIVEVDNQQYRRTQSTDNYENHVRVVYEINIFTNLTRGKKQQAKKILTIVDDLMISKGFTRIMSGPVKNINEATIYRLIARYRALVDKNNQLYRG